MKLAPFLYARPHSFAKSFPRRLRAIRI